MSGLASPQAMNARTSAQKSPVGSTGAVGVGPVDDVGVVLAVDDGRVVLDVPGRLVPGRAVYGAEDDPLLPGGRYDDGESSAPVVPDGRSM